MSGLNVAVLIKLEPDFSEGNVSYNPNGTLNRAETKNTLGPHSAIAAEAAFFAKVMYDAKVSIGTMGPPMADLVLQQAQQISGIINLLFLLPFFFMGLFFAAPNSPIITVLLNCSQSFYAITLSW